jgi:2-polyprenyl-3-methyl-5-hydroxy-6-metoxy-1,4-benzoquinol methylase
MAEHEHPQTPHSASDWDERYAEKVWSGKANAVLISEASKLQPGTALDAGAGEGGDAIWLASHGWRVTGADHSAVGLERAAHAARDAGVEVEWVVLDLVNEAPRSQYDLVTSHFLHLPKPQQPALFAHLAGAVAPGGRLLIVGHDLSDVNSTMHRAHLEDRWWSHDEVGAHLGEGWQIEVSEARPRDTTDQDGNDVTIHDSVLLARRIS